MTKIYQPLFSDSYLRTSYTEKYRKFHNLCAETLLIKRLHADITARETALNEIIYDLYALTDEERRIIDG